MDENQKPKIGDLVEFNNETVVVCGLWGDLIMCESLKFGDSVTFWFGDIPLVEYNSDLFLWRTGISTYPCRYFRR